MEPCALRCWSVMTECVPSPAHWAQVAWALRIAVFIQSILSVLLKPEVLLQFCIRLTSCTHLLVPYKSKDVSACTFHTPWASETWTCQTKTSCYTHTHASLKTRWPEKIWSSWPYEYSHWAQTERHKVQGRKASILWKWAGRKMNQESITKARNKFGYEPHTQKWDWS